MFGASIDYGFQGCTEPDIMVFYHLVQSDLPDFIFRACFSAGFQELHSGELRLVVYDFSFLINKLYRYWLPHGGSYSNSNFSQFGRHQKI